MPCYHPLPAWRAKKPNPSGKFGITFRLADGRVHMPVEIPCGRCIGCQLERSRQWAVRCMHEAKLYAFNCFITLTYDDAHLPSDGSLQPKHFVDFMKRLRWQYGEGIRFFHCGEYGDELGRPHDHALLFNHDFVDRRFYKVENGNRLYTSEALEALWGHGMCTVGEATFESAAYIARYSLKKVVGSAAKAFYANRVPPYLTMSRRPGIGRDFVERYRQEIYRSDSVVVRGVECKPPRYYDQVQEKHAPTVLERVKARRREEAARSPDNSGSRLVVREAVKEAATQSLKRKVE